LFENTLFYDPLIAFYKGNFQSSNFPELQFWKYSINLVIRFLLNAIISISLIWVLFLNQNYLKFSIFLFSVILLVGFALFWIFENNILTENYMKLFYIRRFLIHPILVIILIPAFYFQQLSSKVEK
jgi:exosortase F-associated protein